MTALKFGDPASIAAKQRAALIEVHLRCRREFTDAEIRELLESEDDVTLSDTYEGRIRIVRRWLDRHFENKE